MMGSFSIGLGLACAAMIALMCLPMAIGVIRSRARRRHTNTPGTPAVPAAAASATPATPPTAPLAASGARQASTAGPSRVDS